MAETLKDWLGESGIDEALVPFVAAGIGAAALLVAAVIANFVVKGLVLRVVRALIERSSATWDNVFLERKVFHRLSHLGPAIVFHAGARLAFADFPGLATAVRRLALIYMAVIALLVADAALNAGLDIYEKSELSRRVPAKGFVQVVKLLLVLAGLVFVLSNLLGESPVVFMSGLGAFTAVLLLVFKDPILGLVAGIQLTANNMVRVGDWIEMPKYLADGDVIDVSLTTVKVQNWDKTISTIPAYALVSDSFRNWRGMSESGGRRIKRAIHLDLASVRFCDEEMLERFRGFSALNDYLEERTREVEEYNREHDVDPSALLNGRRLTNVGTFRAYVEAYLRRNPKIHPDLTFLVRQLPPGPQGLPIEIYAFSSDQNWANYEVLQADVFDHLLAAVPLFDLRVYQEPSGADVRALREAVQGEA